MQEHAEETVQEADSAAGQEGYGSDDHSGEAGYDAYGADGHGGYDEPGMDVSEVPEFIQHHIADGSYIDFAGIQIPLPEFGADTLVSAGPAAVVFDLSPSRHLIFMVLAAILCVSIFIPLAKKARARREDEAPKGFANGMEALVLFFRDNVARQNIGHGADAFTPFILTVFFFILTMNLLGLTPFGITPTANLSVTAALAMLAFLVTEISGMRELGAAGYMKTIFFLPSGMSPMIGIPVMLLLAPVEFLGKLTKPFALAVRLFANMTAGHTLVLAILGMIFVFQNFLVAIGAVGVASIIMILEVFVAFLQAFIFTMLTSVFIGLIRHAH